VDLLASIFWLASSIFWLESSLPFPLPVDLLALFPTRLVDLLALLMAGVGFITWSATRVASR